MIKFYILLLTISALANTLIFTEDDYNNKFNEFKRKFKKDYKPGEEGMRKELFRNKLDEITEYNTRKGLHSIRGINKFSDRTTEELKKVRNFRISDEMKTLFDKREKSYKEKKVQLQAPTSRNWCTDNYCTPIKDQGQCGSCWAVASTTAIESVKAIATDVNVITEMSPKHMLDCSGAGDCDGGYTGDAMIWLEYDMDGMCSEADYPYQDSRGSCVESSCGERVGDISNVEVGYDGNIRYLRDVVGDVSPVVVTVTSRPMMDYESGIFYANECPMYGQDLQDDDIDHVVVLVGYTNTYWIIRNSWGTSWGENGFMRLEKSILCEDAWASSTDDCVASCEIGWFYYIPILDRTRPPQIQLTSLQVANPDPTQAELQWHRVINTPGRNFCPVRYTLVLINNGVEQEPLNLGSSNNYLYSPITSGIEYGYKVGVSNCVYPVLYSPVRSWLQGDTDLPITVIAPPNNDDGKISGGTIAAIGGGLLVLCLITIGMIIFYYKKKSRSPLITGGTNSSNRQYAVSSSNPNTRRSNARASKRNRSRSKHRTKIRTSAEKRKSSSRNRGRNRRSSPEHL